MLHEPLVRSAIFSAQSVSWNPFKEFPAIGCVLDVDFENGRYYWGGSLRSLSDLTNVSGSIYTLNYDCGFVDSMSVAVEYTPSATLTPTGTLFSFSNGAGQRFEIDQHVNVGIERYTRMYMNPPGAYASPAREYPGQSAGAAGMGRRAVQYSFVNGGTVNCLVDNYISDPGSTPVTAGTLSAPTTLRFAGRQRFNDQPLTNSTLHRVTIWNSNRSSTEMDDWAQKGVNYPFHMLGDSGLNNERLLDQVRLLTAGRGYLGTSQDGVGGTSLTQQAIRYASPYSKWFKSTLVVMDLGLDGTGQQAVIALQDMVARQIGKRWLYIQSNPQNGYSSGSPRTTWESYQTMISDYCGNHFVPTLAGMQAANNGSAEDLADVADGIWPRSLRIDTVHLNAAGQTALAAIIYNALVDRGYV